MENYKINEETADNFRSMNIFLSYGHPEKDIVKKIVEALEAKGHKVWIDSTELDKKGGIDWREKITQGIENSEKVVACMSKHSVRSPGVCLDELAIAIGVKGGNIASILLENEKEVEPPASICHLQWLDMTAWKEKMAQGDETFKIWFDERMKELLEIIESKESREFVGQITFIKKKLDAYPSMSKQKSLLQKAFIGREWLERDLENWIEQETNEKLCVIYGKPGIGKSAFAANYMHYNPKVAAGIFCEYDKPNFNTPIAVISTLAYLLACRLPAYREQLAMYLSEKENWRQQTESEIFDYLLANPLERYIDGNHEKMVLIIDGLDECGTSEKNSLAKVLYEYSNRLPRWLKIVVLSRTVSAVMHTLGDIPKFVIEADSEENLKDIRKYFEYRLSEKYKNSPVWEEALNCLCERSGGVFLYAEMVVDAILKGKLLIENTDDFPIGLSACFMRWFGWFFPDTDKYKSFYRKVLSLIIAAPEAVPKEELARLLELDNSEVNDFIRLFDVLLKKDTDLFGKETISLSHKYLSDWLTMEEAGCYQVDKADGEKMMAKGFYAAFKDSIEDMSEYEVTHIIPLAEKHCKKSVYREIMLSHDLFWRIADLEEKIRPWSRLETIEYYCNLLLKMGEHLAKRGEIDDRRDLAESYDRMGNMRKIAGDNTGAEDYYTKSLETIKEVVKERGSIDDRRDLFVSCGKMGDMRQIAGDNPGAEDYYTKSLETIKKVVKERGSIDDLKELSVSYGRMGNMRKIAGDNTRAEEYYTKSLETIKEVVKERGSIDDRRELSVSYSKMGDMQKIAGDNTRAEEYYTKSLEIRKEIIDKRGSIDDLSDLSVSYDRMGGMRKIAGDNTGAEEYYTKSLEIAEEIVDKRGSIDDLSDLAISYDRMGNMRQIAGDNTGAEDYYTKSLETIKEVVDKRGSIDDLRDLSVSYSRMGDMQKIAGDNTGAEEYYTKSLEIAEEIVDKRGSIDDRRELSVSYDNMGNMRQIAGDNTGAEEYYTKSLEIAEEIVEKRGSVNDYNDLAVLYYKMVSLTCVSNIRQRKYAEKGLYISKKLYAKTNLENHKDLINIFRYLLKKIKYYC